MKSLLSRIVPGCGIARVVAAGLASIVVLASASSAQLADAADAARWCPVFEREYPCGDGVYGGCPVSECRRLLRQLAYAPAGEKETLKGRYQELCVDDGECQTLERGLRSLLGPWSEMLRRAEESCSPVIDHDSLANLGPLPEKCRGSSLTGLHQRLRRLRCQIVQENGRDCPERVPCPVLPAVAKQLLTPQRRLCPYAGDDVVEIFRCRTGAQHAHLGALCPGERDAAEKDCQSWVRLDLAQWGERLGAEALSLVDVLPAATDSATGWLTRLGGAAPTPGLRLTSRQAWSIASAPTTPPIFVLLTGADGTVYGGNVSPGGEADLKPLEGWHPDRLAPAEECPDDALQRHLCDWRTLQRELLRFDPGMRPFVTGEHVAVEGSIESVRCFADPEALSAMRCLASRTDPLDRNHEELEPNLFAWQPLRSDWFGARPTDAASLERVVAELGRSREPFHILAFGEEDDRRALVSWGDRLGVLVDDGGAWRYLPTGELMNHLLPESFRRSPEPDLEAARRLVSEQLELPGAALVAPPIDGEPDRTCWLAEAGALHCFEEPGGGSVPFDPSQLWARGSELRTAAEEFRAVLHDEIDPADHPVANPLRSLLRSPDLAPVVDVLRQGGDWSIVRAVSEGEVRDRACRMDLRLEFPNGTSGVEFVAWHGLAPGDTPDCAAVLRQHYASLEDSLDEPLHPLRRLAPLGLVSSPPSPDGGLSDIVGLAYHEGGDLRFLLFQRNPPAGIADRVVGPYDWTCVRREAERAKYGRFAPDLAGFADLVLCLADASHPCRTNNIQSPGVWLSGESEANRCIINP